MPNIESAIKRARTSKIANESNSAKLSKMRTAMKKFEKAVEENADNQQELLVAATREIDMVSAKGLIHQNKANREKSRLAKKIAK
ncbi:MULTISPECIES: 30S ribosomal protein S20 [Enterococcaceae]|uniref:Small ribosomal subunit protein bS20 n=2 Tax=Vagococcus TaxID=2737 RepID=A0A429ZQI7_9ENTE|nr:MULTISPECIES: 30S ribosomal protein S20 [Enterococcaceae]MCI0130146.1 30S ribosomal protein S20 [Vagococcus sp. CY53-2]RGI31009.1 30S ribosomal protein S20 [Melissococcus sp. OM08-11BH]RST95984.1 30S ribosomal protein S20 [Vagococcus bubulae]UNM88970.1 30S ribosomal protein S20 [Vagococcus sp. CY52-2]UUV99044.1 30S ribosomal protein S20 [Vagococcus luciliae]